MTTQQLPGRPNLEQLKRQAKDLLRAAQNHEPTALARLRALPVWSAKNDDELARLSLALHDAQSVIAREHGFPSWNALRERVEELTLQFAEAVDAFVHAATDQRPGRAERLLALHPEIARAGFHTALVLGDAAAVEARLRENPKLAVEPGGPRGWEPLLYLCHLSLVSAGRANETGLVAIARRLLALGADPNARFPWYHHGVRRAALWGACFATRSLPLAGALLDAGADPNDGVTLTIAAGGGDLAVLELLHARGADVNFPWATDGSAPVYSILGWAQVRTGVQWLLEHGADANRVCGDQRETALHVAAQKWDVPLVELLVRHGAEIAPRRADGRTPYALAELNGNRDVAAWLLAHGSPGELSAVDRFAAACSRGDRAAAAAMLAGQPELRSTTGGELAGILREAAERDDVPALETMLACGFDPSAADGIGRTALHCAAHAGRAAAVRVLLAHGASVTAQDVEFHAPPLIWAAEGVRYNRRPGCDFPAVARLLIDAGSPVEWQAGDEPADDLGEILAEWRRG